MSWNKKKTFLDLINVYSSCSFQGIWFNFSNFLWFIASDFTKYGGSVAAWIVFTNLSSYTFILLLYSAWEMNCRQGVTNLQTLQGVRLQIMSEEWNSTNGYTREYWMISRKQGFLAVVWFDSSPAPRFSPQIWCKILLILIDRVSLNGIYVTKTKTPILCPLFCY